MADFAVRLLFRKIALAYISTDFSLMNFYAFFL